MELLALASLPKLFGIQADRLLDFYNAAKDKISLDDLKEFGKIWRKLDSTAHLTLQPTIEEALRSAVTLANPNSGLQAFVTGHSRLVGPALSFLEPLHQNSYLGENTEDHI